MPDTTNLLGADGKTILAWWAKRPENTYGSSFAALRDEIVRQAREGMVPQEWFDRMVRGASNFEKQRDEARAENARLRAELETAKREWGREALLDFLQSCIARRGHVLFKTAHHEVAHRLVSEFRECEYPAPAVADTPTPDVRTQRQDLHDELDRTFPVYADFERFVRSAVADTGEREVTLLGGCKVVESEDVPRDELWFRDASGKLIVLRVAMGGGK